MFFTLPPVRNYKATQTQQKLDWVKIRSRYEQIAAQFKKEYPEQPSDLYPHKRETVTAKLKKIQTAYKKAEDSKKKSGGGRVVMTFYSICIEIWGGRPAMKSLSDGFESSSVNEGTHKGSANGAVDDDDDEVQEDPFIDICICEGISDSPSSSFLQQILVNMALMRLKAYLTRTQRKILTMWREETKL